MVYIFGFMDFNYLPPVRERPCRESLPDSPDDERGPDGMVEIIVKENLHSILSQVASGRSSDLPGW